MIMEEGKDLADLALAALMDRHFQFLRRLSDDAARQCLLPFEENATTDLKDIAVFGVPVQNNPVYLLHFIGRVAHFMRQFPVVGQQQKPGRVLIQAAYGMQPASQVLRDKLQDGLLRMGVADSAHCRLRFMEKEINLLGEMDRTTVKKDFVRRWTDIERRLCDLFAVDGHAAGQDRLKGLAPGTDAGVRQKYLKTHKAASLPGLACPQRAGNSGKGD